MCGVHELQYTRPGHDVRLAHSLFINNGNVRVHTAVSAMMLMMREREEVSLGRMSIGVRMESLTFHVNMENSV